MLRIISKSVPILLLLGALLCFFLTILTGATEKSILKHFYWLEADTSSYSTSNSHSRWTNYGLCSVVDGSNTNCGSNAPAYPFSPADNFQSTDNLPSSFIHNRDTYFYLSRIGYGFALVGIFTLVLAFVPIVIFLITGGMSLPALILFGIALLFIFTSVILSTACYVKGRNTFHNDHVSSHLGAKTFGVAWATVACLLLMIPFLVLNKSKSGYGGGRGGGYSYYEDYDDKHWALSRKKRREAEQLRRQQMIDQRDLQVNQRGGVNFMSLIQKREAENGGVHPHRAFDDDNEENYNNVNNNSYYQPSTQQVYHEEVGDTTVATSGTKGSKFNFFRIKRNKASESPSADSGEDTVVTQNQGLSYEEQVQQAMRKIEESRSHQNLN
ncbi:hypothetical protein CANARDRAFT_26263 [[Candida] arabinofermentans NRRL YB-2248]|uniref:Uncharacterized protein n=1 Tax=[Candida] arabinofermentans NRRL YB-2248 TaxID=983967 RepID=A0A1E4T8L7_9ASCO|nr:hypothetical protein CANARDRAFT_26263 [[Candida] arabinofermentans NRRL YB-2248]